MIEPAFIASPLAPLLETLPSFESPVELLGRVRHRRHPVLLLSGLPEHPGSRYSILAWDPCLVVSITGSVATLTRPDAAGGAVARRTGDPFDLLRLLAPADPRQRSTPALPFAGGAIGYLGYGLRRAIERLPWDVPDPLGLPDAWFGVYDRAVVFDHREGRAVLASTDLLGGEDTERRARAGRTLLEARQAVAGPGIAGGAAVRSPASVSGGRGPALAARRRATLCTPRDDYQRTIERALAYIGAGDIYQVNLSHRIECPFDGDPVDLFADLARRNPAPFAAYLDTGAFQVVSSSPERLVSLVGSRARSSPIKGTRPRGERPVEDDRLARDLLESAKDRAENVMIADLVRNDLGRVCVTGSVRVETLCGLESFATVHHLVSTVAGRLRPDADRIDLLRALFPGGSMTGAPKVRAMEIIDELEREERGVYSGGIGYLSLQGGMDFNVVIRTIVCSPGRAHLRVGGGIVADSDPQREYRETLDKGRALLDVLGADLQS